MKQYLELVSRVLRQGTQREDRTGTGTISVFGTQTTFDLREGFPATTSKRLAFKAVVGELLGFIKGVDNLNDFDPAGAKIWQANYEAKYWTPRVPGDLGRIYGVNWRDWQSVTKDGHAKSTDQLMVLIKGLKNKPASRRHLVITYNPGELDQVVLPPCHYAFQCFVENGSLDMIVVMRSLDLFLGMPFDIASYAILQTMLAREVGLTPRMLTFQCADTHIYMNHIEQVKEMLSRTPTALPQLAINPNKSFFELTMDDFELLNYYPHPTIPAPMAV